MIFLKISIFILIIRFESLPDYLVKLYNNYILLNKLTIISIIPNINHPNSMMSV